MGNRNTLTHVAGYGRHVAPAQPAAHVYGVHCVTTQNISRAVVGEITRRRELVFEEDRLKLDDRPSGLDLAANFAHEWDEAAVEGVMVSAPYLAAVLAKLLV